MSTPVERWVHHRSTEPSAEVQRAMDPHENRELDNPTEVPVDAGEEKQRLLLHAGEQGLDATEAVELAERLAHAMPLPEAYRAVDRRVAAGYTVEEAEKILVGDVGDTRPGNAEPGHS